jgi:hypothetical protein
MVNAIVLPCKGSVPFCGLCEERGFPEREFRKLQTPTAQPLNEGSTSKVQVLSGKSRSNLSPPDPSPDLDLDP